jgi:excisionase family DNA binding protein
MPAWYTSEQAAAVLGVRVDYVRTLLRAGRVYGEKFGTSWMVSSSSVGHYQATKDKRGRRGGRRKAGE